MKLKLAVVTLWAEDVDRTADFYRHVLGLPLLTIDRGRPHFDFGGWYLVILPGKPHRKKIPPNPDFLSLHLQWITWMR
ncbi:MAG TPA: VOC family protein [Anaerolineales bacterium]|nr:VOC family protein [Anaerolineales bacterium]